MLGLEKQTRDTKRIFIFLPANKMVTGKGRVSVHRAMYSLWKNFFPIHIYLGVHFNNRLERISYSRTKSPLRSFIFYSPSSFFFRANRGEKEFFVAEISELRSVATIKGRREEGRKAERDKHEQVIA